MRLSIQVRLVATMALLGLLIVVSGFTGLYGMRRLSLSLADTNDNTMPSAIAIAEAQMALARARLALDRVTMHPELPDSDKTISRAENYLAASDEAWNVYLALPQTAEQKQLSDQVGRDRENIINQGCALLLRALKDHDTGQADMVIMSAMVPLFTNQAVSMLDATT